ncbi:hypothetical protein GOP47_0013050 [Adiantum capillus-veneris]|uniref:Uncharacterized protein n=1 Tax=Adiantum capillus-veneris TaxID=13818 RepID=A0A9D4USA5_ADICA|nr:hypothetical protein GOP47_0013050 [Adiantum capillus-veneris]
MRRTATKKRSKKKTTLQCIPNRLTGRDTNCLRRDSTQSKTKSAEQAKIRQKPASGTTEQSSTSPQESCTTMKTVRSTRDRQRGRQCSRTTPRTGTAQQMGVQDPLQIGEGDD